jgi:hypothetical protein
MLCKQRKTFHSNVLGVKIYHHQKCVRSTQFQYLHPELQRDLSFHLPRHHRHYSGSRHYDHPHQWQVDREEQHLMDAGYVDATNLLHSQQEGVDLLGPVRHNYWWQADTDFDVTHFAIDWQAQTVTCPHDRICSSWTPAQEGKGHAVIKIKFSASVIVRSAPIGPPAPATHAAS